MLGKHADHFMLAQLNERVLATRPNSRSTSLQVPDRERAGTAHVMAKAGFQMPGPQRTVSSSYAPGQLAGINHSSSIPGMGSALPGMGTLKNLPGMGSMHGFLRGLPGMGAITIENSTLITVGAAAFAAWYFLLRKKA